MHLVLTTLKKIRIWILPFLLLSVLINLSSCNSGSSTTTITGEWYQQPSVDAGARVGAVLFNIDGKVYISCGYNGNSSVDANKKFLNDLYFYNPDDQGWEPKADFPGVARQGAVAFVSDGKAYVGLGFDGTNYLDDFYSYDPVTDTWTQVQSFKGKPRRGAFAFTIDDKGYVGNGNDDDGAFKDFYQYDVANNEWITKPPIPLIERTYPFSFVIDGKGYVGGGVSNGSLVEDMYEFDPLSGTNGAWIKKNDLKDDNIDNDPNDKGYTIARDQASTFVLNGKAYVVCGRRNSDTWEYNSSLDTWQKMNAFEGSYRYGAVAYTFDGKIGYVGTGYSGSSLYYNDLWDYDPTQADN
ncbi:MAG TPA: kelch repeat-containing protein [Cyclobacteriaceae bacterium]|jgi:N-acetylneuraminic acid mutarotase|nr:kelch repeat-containing protein [Cyclobacteriaceae bacterium]